MQAIGQVQSLENQLSMNIRRVEMIANIEIPQLQNIINALTNERPAVQARYDQEVPQANRLAAELESFERRVGWDEKVQAVQNAENLVSQRSNELNRSLSQKANLENQIGRCQQDRSRLANLLNDAKTRLVQSQNRLVAVIQSLVPFDQEKLRLEQQESDLKNQLAAQAQDFEAKLP
jgi:chromosome segregation ATPase